MPDCPGVFHTSMYIGDQSSFHSGTLMGCSDILSLENTNSCCLHGNTYIYMYSRGWPGLTSVNPLAVHENKQSHL